MAHLRGPHGRTVNYAEHTALLLYLDLRTINARDLSELASAISSSIELMINSCSFSHEQVNLKTFYDLKVHLGEVELKIELNFDPDFVLKIRS